MKYIINFAIFSIGFSLISSHCIAQITLFRPVDGYFSSYTFEHEYNMKIRKILLKGVTDTPDAMVIQTGESESAIILTENLLTILRCSETIWNNPNPEKIKVTRSTIKISKELATEIHNLWFTSLGYTSYLEVDPDDDPRDGGDYHLSAFREGEGLRAGVLYFRNPLKLSDELTSIVTELFMLDEVEDEHKDMMLKDLLKNTKSLNSKIESIKKIKQ